ncbi:PREDICTED: F-box protein CPR30-like [Ipomoea nil]|uniref:F-box protein CPR30-like n=1 Tax=Ipomoea nil TaxID=35883 RepID=UPI0009011E47|nr:PREDICTED: F-box protein CPR30-like [Ipomoea nil]XP_019159146.1 PREDICTED: F-box protein CPR30-like [Ipomoea nil]XP_019159147.1 PREDICTED: F-box protein CPR30-like [Ipomoea nil]
MSDHHHFPEELLIEILKRLPVKSLLRFFAVCKSWYILISSPAFISVHCRHHRNGNSATNLLLLLRRYATSYIEEKYSVLNDTDHQLLTLNNSFELDLPISCGYGYFCTVGFYNGVLCLSDDYYFYNMATVSLWNPSIRQARILPFRPAHPFRFVLGFGASPRSDDDLKVVRVMYERKGVNFDIGPVTPPLVEIYSLSTGVWRRITATGVNYYIFYYNWTQVFVNGAVHWIGYKLLEDKSFQSLIAVFTMADELFDEIMLPDELALEYPTNLSIMVFEEFVAVVKYTERIHADWCELWIMKEYGVVDSWTWLHTIELVGGMTKIVGFRKNGEILLSTNKNELVSYCPNTRVVNDLGISGDSSSFYVDKYLESLVLLKPQTHLVN